MTSMIMSFIVWALCGDLRAKAMAHAQAAGGECLGRWVHWAEGGYNRRWVRVDGVAEACRGFGHGSGEGSGGVSL